MAATFYAHSTQREDASNWQLLFDHLVDVAALAATNAAPLGLREAARMAGMLHDLGKFDPAFQERLRGSKQVVDHSTAGAWHVRHLAGVDRGMADLIAYAIAGHHAGLPDTTNDDSRSLVERLSGFDPARLDQSWQEALPLPTGALTPENVKRPEQLDQFGFHFALLGRMLFSCLVDADYRDTEAFYARTEGREVDRTWPSLAEVLPQLQTRYNEFMARKAAQTGAVNTLRRHILLEVRARAMLEPGFFTLTVPTGGGKTLASLGFALDHAKRHGHRRIICAIPFTSIIDQTAAIFRSVLEEEPGSLILEHHSALEAQDAGLSARDREARSKLRLAMEDWAAPIVVTTNVQVFESLFAARPGRTRKLHNMARSIIILDEAQTLPRNLLIPAVWALRELVNTYGCSVVLCTATQPALEKTKFPPIINPKTNKPRPHALGLDLKGRELAPEPLKLAKSLKRVTLRHGGILSDEALLEALAEQPDGLAIVNSRRHALELFRAGQKAGLEGMVHLTTRQYAAHRRMILAYVRERLKKHLPCRLIATSLIEAGVDVDFSRVWRAESGLDQIIQAAGRCNREGRHSPEESLVTIFEAENHKPHGEMKALAEAMNRVRAKYPDLASPEAMEAYFHEVYWLKGEDGLDRGADGQRITARFSFSLQGGLNLAYRSVASAFQMIEDGMEPVIVARDAEAKALVEKLGLAEIPTGALARGLQSYIVQVRPKDRARLIENGLVRFISPELRADQFAVLQSDAHYSDDVGLEWERADELGEYMF